jgi:hypothetical protein
LSNTDSRRARIVERLARRMYEANDAGGVPWLQRGWVVREAWLSKAQKKRDSAGSLIDRLYVWGRAKLSSSRAPL